MRRSCSRRVWSCRSYSSVIPIAPWRPITVYSGSMPAREAQQLDEAARMLKADAANLAPAADAALALAVQRKTRLDKDALHLLQQWLDMVRAYNRVWRVWWPAQDSHSMTSWKAPPRQWCSPC